MFMNIYLDITHNKNGDFMNLENITNKNIITININDKISSASLKMKEHNIGFLPVEQNKHIVGVITDRDIACNINDEQNITIENTMTNNVINISIEKTPQEALELMKKEKIKRLIVSKEEKVIGIISLSDLINTNIDQNQIIETIKHIWSPKEKNTTNTNLEDLYL